MKRRIILNLLLSAAFIIIGDSCVQLPKEKESVRIPFQVTPEEPVITLPVSFNDSTIANMHFDSGALSGALVLDSSFCSTHPDILFNVLPDTTVSFRSAWSTIRRTSAAIYHSTMAVKIGKEDFIYNRMEVLDWKRFIGVSADGMLNIGRNDTTHVWEFNFEHNYLEIHNAHNFVMPDNSWVLPFIQGINKKFLFFVQLPLSIKCPDGDTLNLNRTFQVDTGMPCDIALTSRAGEFLFFDQRKDAVWTQDLLNYNRYYTVDATLFNKIQMDSLRIYTFDYANTLSCNYLIGLNFLKRFNVFFDMKSQRLGLQPINNYKRVVNPRKKRFHMSSRMNSHGKLIITKIADYESNYIKKAGLLEGDEIVAINGIPIKMITIEENTKLNRRDTLVYDIVSQGKSYKIPVVIDRNEVQGD